MTRLAIVSGLIAQLVKASHRCHEVTGSNPVEVLTFSAFYIRHCINLYCVHNCEDHSLLETRRCNYTLISCLESIKARWLNVVESQQKKKKRTRSYSSGHFTFASDTLYSIKVINLWVRWKQKFIAIIDYTHDCYFWSSAFTMISRPRVGPYISS